MVSQPALNTFTASVTASDRRLGGCDQEKLEECILRYQKAREDQNQREQDQAFSDICALYPPLHFVRFWFRKYRYLYDTRDDFMQEYMILFCKSLSSWKPRGERRQSRFEGGSGTFKNFFWSVLQNHFSNQVKGESAQKRNHASKCPLCDEWCNTLSTHLRDDHTELLWEQVGRFGYNIELLDNCPFCTSYKPLKSESNHKDKISAIKRHFLSCHSSFLFQRFQEMFPDYVTLSPKPSPVIMTGCGEDQEELNLYDITPSNSLVDRMLAHNLTSIQKTMVARILNGGKDIHYDYSLYKCTSNQFQQELEGLRNTLTLCGLEG